MPLYLIPFPAFDPVLVQLGPVQIRWYALAYVFGLTLGWLYARWMVAREDLWGGVRRPTTESLDNLLVYAAFGVIVGGRLGYVLFYNLDLFIAKPLGIFAVWNGGMSFHGGLVGSIAAIWLFARNYKLPILIVGDVTAAATPIGLLLGRLANFIKPELWGRPSDVAWAMVFPPREAMCRVWDTPLYPCARHPSQLYEAALEGLVLFVVLHVMVRRGALRRPGTVAGVFCIGYGAARIFSEFFREPDIQLGFLFGGATMGMLLSLPLIAVGFVVLALSRRTRVGVAA